MIGSAKSSANWPDLYPGTDFFSISCKNSLLQYDELGLSGFKASADRFPSARGLSRPATQETVATVSSTIAGSVDRVTGPSAGSLGLATCVVLGIRKRFPFRTEENESLLIRLNLECEILSLVRVDYLGSGTVK